MEAHISSNHVDYRAFLESVPGVPWEADAKSWRFTYSFPSNGLQTVVQEESRFAPAPLAGVDVRLEVGRGFQVVALYRMHVLLGGDGMVAPRETFLHRPGAGIYWNFTGMR